MMLTTRSRNRIIKECVRYRDNADALGVPVKWQGVELFTRAVTDGIEIVSTHALDTGDMYRLLHERDERSISRWYREGITVVSRALTRYGREPTRQEQPR